MASRGGLFDFEFEKKAIFDPEMNSDGIFDPDFSQTVTAAAGVKVPYQPQYTVAPVMAQ